MLCVKSLEDAYYSLKRESLRLLSGRLNDLLERSLSPTCEFDEMKTILIRILSPSFAQLCGEPLVNSFPSSEDTDVRGAIAVALGGWANELSGSTGVKELPLQRAFPLPPRRDIVDPIYSSRALETISFPVEDPDLPGEEEHPSPQEMSYQDNKSVASSSTVGSGVSSSSYTSVGSRRGRRRWISTTETTRPTDNSPPYRCAFCGKDFPRKSTCRRHEQSIHLPQRLWVCHRLTELTPGMCYF
ncbi:uncharacterized protein PV06_08997 [Exophiala oligosperma]|uniref:C2H2-type domain-containing protein n=1 Tax=Exophiala oligosperma TaxID=215243 RepID=A0A0D2BNW1_9EURO|nr:uncharacterized protein PV06_08997 [Exophiala oligosperma]KIW39202.1 hypothetical protein PV06_08997 [Exophiala oligosperma]